MHFRVGQEPKLGPEESDGSPSSKAVNELELVMHSTAYPRVSHCDNGDQQNIKDHGDCRDAALVALQ